MDEMECPNCGRHLKRYKTERQPAGNRIVLLQWARCEGCSHVALSNWSFSESDQDRIREERRRPFGALGTLAQRTA